MTLTIEQVRDTRFHLARRNGYDPADVDTFVDKVETTLVALGEENATLQQQVSTLSASGGGADGGEWRQAVEAKDAEIERLRQELNAARSGQSNDAGILQRQVDEAREQLQARERDFVAQLRAKDEDLAHHAAALQSKDEEIARRQDEIANLHNSLAGGGDKAAHLESELTGRDQQIAQLRVQVQELRGEVSSREAELLTLRGQVQQLKQAPPSSSGVVAPVAGFVAGAGLQQLVVRAASDASPAVTRLVQMATEQAEALVGEAKSEADRTTTEARSLAQKLTSDARSTADALTSDAHHTAERVTSEAQASAEKATMDARDLARNIEERARAAAEKVTVEAAERAAQVDKDAASRRDSLFTTLEAERDELTTRVDHLRAYEQQFRSSFTTHLEKQITALRENRLAPEATPDLLRDGIRGTSATPRLDALLNDER